MTARKLPTFTGPNHTGKLQLNFHEVLGRRDIHVRRVEDITPRYRRITFGGADLAMGFPLARFAPLDHVKLYFPDPTSGEIVSYRPVGDDWEVDSDSGAPIRRDYTPRAWDADAGELSIDFVLHGHGIAGAWARNARPGDRLVAMGPSANWFLPENYAHYIAIGDETALPAISRIIEEAPAQSRVTALIEIATAAEEQVMFPASELDLRWVHRDTAPVGPGHLSPLETAFRRLDFPAPAGSVFVFGAGEVDQMRPIRRYLRTELVLAKRQVIIDGYWRRGTADFDHHEADLDG